MAEADPGTKTSTQAADEAILLCSVLGPGGSRFDSPQKPFDHCLRGPLVRLKTTLKPTQRENILSLHPGVMLLKNHFTTVTQSCWKTESLAFVRTFLSQRSRRRCSWCFPRIPHADTEKGCTQQGSSILSSSSTLEETTSDVCLKLPGPFNAHVCFI